VLQKFLTVVITAFAVFIAFKALWSIEKGQPVAATFTRVGGRTRIETAVEASRFWRTPLAAKSRIVTTRAYENQNVLWGAAKCAARHNYPLLFTSLKRTSQKRVKPLKPRQMRLVDGAILRLAGRKRFWTARLPVMKSSDVDHCLSKDRLKSSHADGCLRGTSKQWQALEIPSYPPLLLPTLGQPKNLAPVVVFAARKAPTDPPDVAVGLVLAAHTAHVRCINQTEDRTVSLVVVPRYLEAGPRLEGLLRDQHEAVKSGLVLGENKVFSEDMRALLRQVLTSPDQRGILGGLDNTLGALKDLLKALVGLLVTKTLVGGAQVAPDLHKLLPRFGRIRKWGVWRWRLRRPHWLHWLWLRIRKGGHINMSKYLATLLRFRSLLGLLGAAVVIYGCVIVWWQRSALGIILVVGAVLVSVAFIVDWEGRAARKHRKDEAPGSDPKKAPTRGTSHKGPRF
jgi:hypothetical protein